MKLILLSIYALALIRTSSSEPCNDHFNCPIYPNTTCKTDEWVILNCPKKCNVCSTPVNPLLGWEASPTTNPDISINAPFRNYTYPKPDEPSTATIHAAPLPAASAPAAYSAASAPAPLPAASAPAAYPVSAPAPAAAYPTVAPTAGYPASAPNAAYAPAPVPAYPTSAPSAAYPAPTQAYPTAAPAYPAPTQHAPVYGMPIALPPASNQYPVAGQQSAAAAQTNTSPNWVVKIPRKVQESLQHRPETIRISFVKKHPFVQQQEVNIKPKNENGQQTMKISFIDEKPSKPIPHGVSQVRLPQTQSNNENIRVSFREPQIQPQNQPMGLQYGQSAPQRNISVSFMGHENETLSSYPSNPSLIRNISVAFTGHENETVSIPLVNTTAALPERNISLNLNGNHDFSMPVSGQGAEDIVNQVMNGAVPTSRNISISFLEKPLNPGQVTVESNAAGSQWNPPVSSPISTNSQPWCQDHPGCSQFQQAQCEKQWMQINCPSTCSLCENEVNDQVASRPTYKQLSVNVPQELTSSLETSREPVVVKIATEGGVAEISKETRGPIMEKINVHLPSHYLYDKADQSGLTNPLTGGFEVPGTQIPEAKWCSDDADCNKYSTTQCGEGWMEKNCPKMCKYCRPVCQDKSLECERYSAESCSSDWMKENCQKSCAICEGLEHQQQDTSKMSPTTDNVALLAQVGEANLTLNEEEDNSQCFYDGLKHNHGDRWSPGPCTPECRCHDGNIHCTIIECPKLHCKNTIKRRWKCCPECPPNEAVNSKCTKTFGGNGAGSCCVFPFSYRNKQYTKCIEDNHSKPWCAVSSDFDIDDMWGNCLGQGQEMSDDIEAELEKTIKVSFLNSHHNDEMADAFLPSTALVTGLYSSWYDWTKCSASCGGGTQERTRRCLNPNKAPGGAVCDSLGPGLETKECNIRLCPIDGGYGNWSEWSNCDAVCGGGVRQRYRTCTNPLPAHGGKDCLSMNLGPALVTHTCNTIQCPTDGMYTDWTGWSKCTKPCGLGKRYRFRYCTNPSPGPGGHNCSWYGNDKEDEYCNNKECEVDGGYTPWSQWTECSRTCGPGIISRHRMCDSPIPSSGGKDCSNYGSAFEQKSCRLKECPSSGNWTVWSKWSTCTRSCGGGVQFRSRQCTHPGGLDYCLGERVESSLCNSYHCPVDGNYTEFSDWTPCTTTCGVGIKSRERSCNNPLSQFRGQSCEEQGMGLATEHEHCYNRQCPIHGEYTIWSEWKGCSKKCGYGERTRTRSCTHPAPINGGLDCARLGGQAQIVQCYNAECPLHGNYTVWSNWSTCSATCGEGTTSRTRICANPEPAHDGDDCSALGSNIEAKTCSLQECAVNGAYSPWSSWSICSKSCGSGITRKIRTCTDPAPLHGGKNCTEQSLGAAVEVSRCFDAPCPLNGGFNDWSAWTTCSASCGGGVMFRHRNCTSPQSMHGGKDCSNLGPSTESASCQDEQCPVNGNYGIWSSWSDCDKTCGGGKRIRSRSCTNPPAQFGGTDCSNLGPLNQAEVCNLDQCPVHGNYSNWSLWSPCSVTCGVGTVERQRYCTNPPPSVDGRNCDDEGPETEKKSCELVECTATCRCGPWAGWSDCTATCGGGLQQRKRECFLPKKAKLSCEADSKETRLCMPEPCPINGKYTPWSPWTACSATCGIGLKNRTRLCNAPFPQFGGKSCAEQEMGAGIDISKCYLMPCPVNGDYTDWSDWSMCSKSCGRGYKERKRFCNNPEPAYGGVDCDRLGAGKEDVECFNAECPVDGKYTEWTPWSSCSQTCGYGIQTRARSCTKPEPMHGGRDCTDQGDPEHIRPCQNIPCPIHGNYSSWSAWGACSKSCGDGIKKRTRLCNHPEPEFGGLSCQDQNQGLNIEETKCAIEDCSVDGGWNAWSHWSGCSTACGPGTRVRKRDCTKPEPKSGGKKCEGASEQVGDCTSQPCPVNGNYTAWSRWSVCDKDCSSGVQTRWRACANPVPQHGGLSCSYMGPDTETKLCLNKPCLTDGRWSEWSVWSTCSTPCGDGERTRERKCDNPRPMEGGRNCDGESIQYAYCKASDCCDVKFKPVGCYRDNSLLNDRPMPELLLDDADTSSKYNDDPMDVKKWNEYLPNLVCRCARTANLKGYSHFGLQDTSSCFSGSRSGMTFAKDGIQGAFIQSPGPKPWVGCVTNDYEQCDLKSKYCSGQQNSNFVYTFYNITPVDGGYSDFSPWTSCSRRCGIGYKSRVRNCTNPKPEYGGRDCNVLGDEVETAVCDTNINCAVDGAFSDWSKWTNCSSICGKGSRVRERSCTAPTPSIDGKPCIGPVIQRLSCNLGDCPVNGSWSAWGAWQACSATCGDGIQTRLRDCNHPKASNGGFSCEGDRVEQKSCKVRRCPVDGNYTVWSDWSDCSRTCGGGIHFRTRDCASPYPKYGGKDCDYYGDSREVVHCNLQPCPIHGNWGAWQMWSFCSSTCGAGKRERMRLCNNPPPKYGGQGCPGTARETMPCSLSDCPVDGNWGAWKNWTQCSTTCGASKKSRTRECNDPPAAHGGRSCEGPEKEEAYCDNVPCMVNGGYTEWGAWTQCDVTCGGGRRQRSRACTNPLPQFGGRNCKSDGAEVEEDSCNTRPCAQNGEWSGWSVWSPCSRSCGSGVVKRIRTCTAPRPSFGGESCPGEAEEIKACKIRDCCEVSYRDLGCFRDDHNTYRPLPKMLFSDAKDNRVDLANWETYLSDVICRCARSTRNNGFTTFALQNYGDCYSGGKAAETYYQEGEQLAFSDQNQPKPWLGCIDSEKKECHSNNLECGGQERTNYVYTVESVQPMQGNYTGWSSWSKCSKPCGIGERYRTRNCTNPPPAWGGLDCRFEGNDREQENCKIKDCPTDANWRNWGKWSSCTVSCGRGIVRRHRTCDDPAPKNGGKPCPGYAHETAECRMSPCPVHGKFADWSAWSTCSVTCGNGRQIRSRKCDSPKPAFGGNFCQGPDKEFQNCEEDNCPGYFSDWTPWTTCSATCGAGGTRERSRTCQGGSSCAGSARQVERCDVQHCPSCPNSIDLAFLLDASGTIDDSQWKLTKDFVRGLSSAFHLADNGTRTAVITFSTLPHLEKTFQEMNDKTLLDGYLDSVTQPRGETRTDRALKLAREHILSDDSGARESVPKAVVLITDGGSRAKSKMSIQRRAHELKDLDGATVVVLGVGENVDRQEMRQIVSDPGHAYLVSSYDDLMQYVKLASDAVCNAKPPPPPPRWGRWSDWSPCMKTCGEGISIRTRKCLTGANCRGTYAEKRRCVVQTCPECHSPTDLAFAVPISSKIKDTEWHDVQNFVKGTANAFNISYAGTHLGLLSYSSMATLELKFNRYYYQKDIFTMIDNVFPEASSEEGTRLDDALQVANYELFTPASGSRTTAAKSLIVLSYGELGLQKLKNIAHHLQDNKVRSVVITVGQDEADRRQADSLTENSNHTFHVGTFKDLVEIIGKTVYAACYEPEPVLPPKVQTQATQTEAQTTSYNTAVQPQVSPLARADTSPTKPPAIATIQQPPSDAPSQWAAQTSSTAPTTIPSVATSKAYPTLSTSAQQTPQQPQVTQSQQTQTTPQQAQATQSQQTQTTSQQAQATQPQQTQTTPQQAQATQPQQTQTTKAQKAQPTQPPQTQPMQTQQEQIAQPVQQTPTYWGTEAPKVTQPPYQAHAATQSLVNMPQEPQSTAQNGHYVCPHNMDIVVALDSSSDVSPLQWAHQKNFARNVMEGFTLSDAATHCGVVAYSTIPSIQSKLDEKNQHDEVIKSIQSLPRDKGNRNLVILLEMAKFEMFTSSGGMRRHIPKVLLISVMGTQKDHNTNSAKSLQAFSRQLRYSGVHVVVVGVGDVPEDDLKNMATEPNYAMRVNSLQAADEAAKVAKVMCHVGALQAFNNPQAQSSVQNDQPAQASPQRAPVRMQAPVPAAAVTPAVAAASQPESQVDTKVYPYKCRPVLYYDFDKMCSGTVYDESGMGNNGKIQGRILTEGGLLDDNGLDLSQGYIQLDGRGFKGKPTKAVTIAAWVHVKDLSTPNVNEIFVTEAPGIREDQKKGQYHFEILDQGKIRFFQRNYDKTVYGRTTKRVILPNRWVHIAGTYNPGSREATIYVNGERITEYDHTDPQETDALSTDWSDVAQIGSHFSTNQTLRKFKGALDEFYIFPCNLNTNEIKALMATHKIPQEQAPFQGVKRMVWRNITGATISDLALSKSYPNNPSEVSIIPSFSAPENDGTDYGSRISGFFVAPYTGMYSFTLSGDDEAELFFSENASPKDMDLIAAVKTADDKSQSPAMQKSGIVPLDAGKYYWMEALHKQGKSRDALKVGYNLECPSAPFSVVQRSVIPLKSLQYQMPRSCADIKRAWSGYNDDEYAIQLSPSCEPVRLYCHGMRTENPLEYITLEAGPDRNYAAFHRERLLNYESCSGKANPRPLITEKYWGKSRFYKVRVDPATGLIERDDYRFADSQGNPVRYGRAGDCYSASTSCKRGRFQIDLTGTGLRLHKAAQWVPWGTPKISQNALHYRKSPDGTMVYGECGGSCGGCQPKNAKLFVEPLRCLTTPTRAMVRGSIPKVETNHIHMKKSHITTYFNSQPGLDESEMEVIGHIDRKRRNSQNTRKSMMHKIRKFKRRLAKGY